MNSNASRRCGCSKTASYYPTAALSQAAYGSSLASGPACGQCFNVTLRETFGAIPTWTLNEEQRVSTVVKIVVSFLPSDSSLFFWKERPQLTSLGDIYRTSAPQCKGKRQGKGGVEQRLKKRSELHLPFFAGRIVC
jgi:hypothetical protein